MLLDITVLLKHPWILDINTDASMHKQLVLTTLLYKAYSLVVCPSGSQPVGRAPLKAYKINL